MPRDFGILLRDDLALAAFEGRKVVTRRPVDASCDLLRDCTEFERPAPGHWLFKGRRGPRSTVQVSTGAVIRGAGTAEVGGMVWIREAWRDVTVQPVSGGAVAYRAGGPVRPVADDVVLRTDKHFWLAHSDLGCGKPGCGWRPSIHMPKWACRTWGRITSVRPCDLSDIDDAEAKLEGFETADQLKDALRTMYPTQQWFWRIQWEPIEVPNAA